MKVALQRVKKATVSPEGETQRSINQGLLLYVGFGHHETLETLQWMSQKICKLRVFPDQEGKMNLSVEDVRGELLIISQFTLYGETKKGTRPSFKQAGPPDKSKIWYQQFIQLCKESGLRVESGAFGAHMEIGSINDGPVTLLIER
ncbi:MAG: D-tyrosyl-tRNA(Tyr) deacylase [Rhodothermaceae bacterium TMED105]|nr:MAG: D-tyrosyl-tRNA(Tyr) deacylase [Rhodothermaceae bacterium TMED105]